MPIYAYRCTSCGFEKDVMQKVSEPKLTACPECKTENFAKQLTAPGFQLKGTGWYATDFKGGGSAKAAAAKAEAGGETKSESTSESPSSSTPAASSSGDNGAATPRSGVQGMQSSPAPTGAAATASKPASSASAPDAASPAK